MEQNIFNLIISIMRKIYLLREFIHKHLILKYLLSNWTYNTTVVKRCTVYRNEEGFSCNMIEY